jgi:hypothetical protein
MSLPRLLGSLPVRFRWTVHNLIAHPLSELVYQCGFEGLSNRIHDGTVPDEKSKTPGRG